jgi:hypothetical protein
MDFAKDFVWWVDEDLCEGLFCGEVDEDFAKDFVMNVLNIEYDFIV